MKGVTILEAELATKIRSKFLHALEEDDWFKLPSRAYTKGFVVRYGNFLGIPKEEISKLYIKESSIRSDEEDMILPKKSVKRGVMVTPKLIISTVVSVLVLSVISFIIYQVYGISAAPDLMVASPANNIVVDSENIEVKGVTDKDASILINDQKVAVSSDGSFYADYKLHRGINVIEVTSKNKAEREKSVTYTVEYKPQTAQAEGGLN